MQKISDIRYCSPLQIIQKKALQSCSHWSVLLLLHAPLHVKYFVGGSFVLDFN